MRLFLHPLFCPFCLCCKNVQPLSLQFNFNFISHSHSILPTPQLTPTWWRTRRFSATWRCASHASSTTTTTATRTGGACCAGAWTSATRRASSREERTSTSSHWSGAESIPPPSRHTGLQSVKWNWLFSQLQRTCSAIGCGPSLVSVSFFFTTTKLNFSRRALRPFQSLKRSW